MVAETGRLMKSSGVSTRAKLARNFSSMICPKTIPKMIGTIGSCKRFRMKPSIPNTAQTAQSMIELRSEYTPINDSIKIQIPKNRPGI